MDRYDALRCLHNVEDVMQTVDALSVRASRPERAPAWAIRRLWVIGRRLQLLARAIRQGQQPATDPIAVQLELDALSPRALSVENVMVALDEQWWAERNFRYPVPLGWVSPVALAVSYLRYEAARPRLPNAPCVYHMDAACESLQDVSPLSVLGPPLQLNHGWQYFAARNHVWRPCPMCKARGGPPAQPA